MQEQNLQKTLAELKNPKVDKLLQLIESKADKLTTDLKGKVEALKNFKGADEKKLDQFVSNMTKKLDSIDKLVADFGKQNPQGNNGKQQGQGKKQEKLKIPKREEEIEDLETLEDLEEPEKVTQIEFLWKDKFMDEKYKTAFKEIVGQMKNLRNITLELRNLKLSANDIKQFGSLLKQTIAGKLEEINSIKIIVEYTRVESFNGLKEFFEACSNLQYLTDFSLEFESNNFNEDISKYLGNGIGLLKNLESLSLSIQYCATGMIDLIDIIFNELPELKKVFLEQWGVSESDTFNALDMVCNLKNLQDFTISSCFGDDGSKTEEKAKKKARKQIKEAIPTIKKIDIW